MLFDRFDRIEIDSSLIAQGGYPSIKNQTKIAQLTLNADTHNFFIPLLLNMPSSVQHLILKNSTFSANNLIIDISQKYKYNTQAIAALTLVGFDTSHNLKQIQTLLNHDVFANLSELHIVSYNYNAQNKSNIQKQLKNKSSQIKIDFK